MSHRLSGRLLLIVALMTVATFGAGYLLGSMEAPDQQAAAAERDEAELAAYESARAAAWTMALARGIEEGSSEGQRLGLRRGGRRGSLAGLDAIVTDSGPRSESRKDIGSSGPAISEDTGGTLVVGDSLQVLTKPYLRSYLRSEDLTVNAVGGYNSLQIFDLFEESFSPSQSVVVFDAGTNDNPSYPQILADRLRAVEKVIGDRCMVVPTIHGLTVDGVGSRGKNRVVRAFAASRPGTQTPDWARAVASHPEMMQSDDLHPTAEGADLRARLIAESVKGCHAYNSGLGG